MPQRIDMVTGIRPEKLEEYKALHANPPQGVLVGLRRAHVSNYSIFVHGTTLFGYLEYLGGERLLHGVTSRHKQHQGAHQWPRPIRAGMA
jgi:L-rhamnose mutarotase